MLHLHNYSESNRQSSDAVLYAAVLVVQCGQLGMTVGILCRDFADQASTIAALAADFPKTSIVLDHFAGVLPGIVLDLISPCCYLVLN